MNERAETSTRIEPAEYTEEYFRTSVEGHAEFAASGGRRLSPRLLHALDLADPKPGQHVLDIACGRGEMVLQSALRGAKAVGIDYAQAAMHVARQSLAKESDERSATLACMDASRLALKSETQDIALMLDFVEHVHQPELERSFHEVRRALKPGGRLIIHTSPNRVFEEVVYRRYVRNVHRMLLGIVRLLRLESRFFNALVLPTDALPPHNEYERHLHVNPQSAGTLRRALQRSGLRVLNIGYWEPPHGSFFPAELRWHNLGLRLLDIVRFLRPFSRFPPLNRFFSNHIWVVAQRQ